MNIWKVTLRNHEDSLNTVWSEIYGLAETADEAGVLALRKEGRWLDGLMISKIELVAVCAFKRPR